MSQAGKFTLLVLLAGACHGREKHRRLTHITLSPIVWLKLKVKLFAVCDPLQIKLNSCVTNQVH